MASSNQKRLKIGIVLWSSQKTELTCHLIATLGEHSSKWGPKWKQYSIDENMQNSICPSLVLSIESKPVVAFVFSLPPCKLSYSQTLYLHPFELWCFPVLCTSLILLITPGSGHLKFQKSKQIGLCFFEKIQNQKKVQFQVFENFQTPVPVFWKLSESKEPGKIYYRNSKN